MASQTGSLPSWELGACSVEAWVSLWFWKAIMPLRQGTQVLQNRSGCWPLVVLRDCHRPKTVRGSEPVSGCWQRTEGLGRLWEGPAGVSHFLYDRGSYWISFRTLSILLWEYIWLTKISPPKSTLQIAKHNIFTLSVALFWIKHYLKIL